MRCMAELRKDDGIDNFLPRESVIPPDSLQRLVWPQLDGWLDAYWQRPGATETIASHDVATGGFLELLEKMRTIFLQVSKLHDPSKPAY